MKPIEDPHVSVTFDRCDHLLEPAIWGAEPAVALSGSGNRGRVYVVKPTGPSEDDPNVTNKKFPGNVTRSYRTRHALRIVREVHDWEGDAPEALQAMLDDIARDGHGASPPTLATCALLHVAVFRHLVPGHRSEASGAGYCPAR